MICSGKCHTPGIPLDFCFSGGGELGDLSFFLVLVLVLAMQPTSRREGAQPGYSGYLARCWHQIRDERDWLGSALRLSEGDAAMTGHVSC